MANPLWNSKSAGIDSKRGPFFGQRDCELTSNLRGYFKQEKTPRCLAIKRHDSGAFALGDVRKKIQCVRIDFVKSIGGYDVERSVVGPF